MTGATQTVVFVRDCLPDGQDRYERPDHHKHRGEIMPPATTFITCLWPARIQAVVFLSLLVALLLWPSRYPRTIPITVLSA